MTYQPTVHTLKIGVRGPLGDSVHAEHIGRDTDPALILTMSNTDETLLRPAEWRAFRDAVDDLLGEPRTTEDDRPEIETPAGPVRLADAVTVSRDDLDHTKPNTLARANAGLDPFPQSDPLAHVKPGDTDPHPEQDDGDHEICWEQIEASGVLGVDEFTCTRPEGHPGQHIAGDGHEVVKVWRADA